MSLSRLPRLPGPGAVAAALLFVFTICVAAPAQPDEEKAVMVNWQGINHKAHIIGTADGRYHIRYDEHRDGRPDEEWVGVDRLKNRDYSPYKAGGATAGMPRTVPAGHYACVMFV